MAYDFARRLVCNDEATRLCPLIALEKALPDSMWIMHLEHALFLKPLAVLSHSSGALLPHSKLISR
jgi:hypothetical protein